MNLTPLALFEVFGRLHPVMLHMPIGLVGALAGVEAWRLVSCHPGAPHAPRVLGILAAAAAVTTALMGLTLEQEPGYTSDTVELHEWLGLSFAACVVVVAILQHRVYTFAATAPAAKGLAGRRLAYLIALAITTLVMIPTGHFGGEISHGEGFITEPLTRSKAPKIVRTPTTPQVALDLPAVPLADQVPADIQAVFDTTCISCHGSAKQKGGLRLDTPARLWAGSDAGPVVVRGDADASELTWRMSLPLNNDDHMPPKNKPQPTPAQIAAVQAWVNGLAPAK
jgi:mono/diheme cytochrome c family protein